MSDPSRRRMRNMAARAALALCLAAPSVSAQPRKPKPKPNPAAPAASDSIPVTVIEVAGTEAYLQPGAKGGVHRGAVVVINRNEYTVTQTTTTYAVIDTTRSPPHEQDKGLASLVAEEEEKPRELVKPRPLASWERAWTEAPSPANEQQPRFVPLGTSERDRRWDVRLLLATGALLPFGRGPSTESVELNARVHAEPFTAPLRFDLDVSVLKWAGTGIAGRDGSAARPLVWLREALVGYAPAGGWYAGIGRMPYAASTLGALDGARVSAPLGQGFSIGAFGGVLPNPLSGEPSLVAQRFGVETTFSRPELGLRPEAALVAQGSTFGGSLDERRLSGMFGLYPGQSRVGGHFEVSNFDPHNEWKASPIELTAAGLDGSIREGIFELGGRVDLRQPDRSRWLASFLPTSWFCTTVPTTAGNEPCDGSVSTRAMGAVDAGIQVDRVAVTVGATIVGDLTQKGGAPDMKGAFISSRVVRLAKIARIEASGSYSQATYLRMYGGSAGPGVSLFDDALDVSAYYRYAALEYRVDNTSLVQHGVGTMMMLFPNSTLLFTVQGEGVAGNDTKVLMLFGTAMWRPRL